MRNCIVDRKLPTKKTRSFQNCHVGKGSMLILQPKYIYKKWGVWFSFQNQSLGWYNLSRSKQTSSSPPSDLFQVQKPNGRYIGVGYPTWRCLFRSDCWVYINPQVKKVEFIMWFLLFFSKLWSILKLFPKYSFGVCLPISWCQDPIKLHCRASQQSGDLLHQCLGANKNEAGPTKGVEPNIFSPSCLLEDLLFVKFLFGCLNFLVSQLELSSGWLILVGAFFHCLFRQRIAYENRSLFTSSSPEVDFTNVPQNNICRKKVERFLFFFCTLLLTLPKESDSVDSVDDHPNSHAKSFRFGNLQFKQNCNLFEPRKNPFTFHSTAC